MILLIISIVALLLFVLFFILAIKDDIDNDIFGVIAGFSLGMVLISVLFISTNYNWKPDLDRKQELEVLLVNDCNANTILKAQEYNKSVDEFNNYWCRFSIEDRSEYYIDIDSFLEKREE